VGLSQTQAQFWASILGGRQRTALLAFAASIGLQTLSALYAHARLWGGGETYYVDFADRQLLVSAFDGPLRGDLAIIGHYRLASFWHKADIPTCSTNVRFQENSGHWDMSALPPKADIRTPSRNVRFVPIADSCTAAKGRSTEGTH
jgi:hypothetical protein